MRCLIFLSIIFCISVPVFATQTEPATLSYQATLYDSATGQLLTGSKQVRVCLYNQAVSAAGLPAPDPANGSAFWCDTFSVSLKNGQFAVVLGSQKTLIDKLSSFNGNTYVGITIDTENEIPQRQRMNSVPYAFNGLPPGSIALPSGNVGIGTTTPGSVLSVQGVPTAAGILNVQPKNAGTGNVIVSSDSNGTAKFSVDASGNVISSGAVSSNSISTGNLAATSGSVTLNSISTGSLSASGAVNSGSISTGSISASGTLSSGSISTSGNLSTNTLNVSAEARLNDNLFFYLKPGSNGTINCYQYCSNRDPAGNGVNWGRAGSCIGSMLNLTNGDINMRYGNCTDYYYQTVTCICVTVN